MVTVIWEDLRILKMIGENTPSRGVRYKTSPFLYSIEAYPLRWVVINTFTTTLCEVSDEVHSFLKKKELNSSDISEKDFVTLIFYRFIIPTDDDEWKLYDEIYGLLFTIDAKRSGINRYNVLTTTKCNARCFYCFENDFIKQAKSMSPSTAEKVGDYIVDTHSQNEKIYMRWFGGEPLVNVKVIDDICNKLQTKHIDFFSSISTNGLLLNEKILKRSLDKWNLTKIRITLDGFGEEHNRRKNFFGPQQNPFEVIMKNIRMVVDSGIIMTVRLNIDSNNIHSIKQLTEYLINEYKDYGNFNMYCRCFFDDLRPEKINTIKGGQLLTERNRIENLIIENRLYDWEKLAPNFFRVHFCAAHDHRKIVILPSGKVCKCECYASDSVSWGSVENNMIDDAVYDYWNRNLNTIRERCKKCCFLPVCTPFSKCPINYIDCRERIMHTMNLFVKESLFRFLNKIEPIRQMDSIKTTFNIIAP